MERRNEDRGLYTNIIRRRLIEIKAKIRIEKRKVKQELRKIEGLKVEIMELISELEKEGLLKNSDEIIDFMDSIDKKYGFEDSCETDISRLYVELTDGNIPHEGFDKVEEHGIDGEHDDDNDNETLQYVEYIKLYNEMEQKYSLCRSLFNRAELSNFEHTKLRDKLERIRTEKSKASNVKLFDSLNENELDDSLVI